MPAFYGYRWIQVHFFLILIFQLFSTNSNVGFQFLTLNAQNGHLAYILHPQALSPG